MRLLQNIHHYDVLTFSWCSRRKNRDIAVQISRLISRSADGHLYVVAGAFFALASQWSLVKLLALGFVVERLFYVIAKSLFRRRRPPEAIPGFQSVIEPSDQFSFPSGHTSAAFLMTTCIGSVFPAALWVMLPWACSVGAARVILGVHFPTDTLAGALMGHLLGAFLVTLVI